MIAAPAAAPGLFDAVHWQLRSGFCKCLSALVRPDPDAGGGREAELALLIALADGCEMLHRAEHEALARLRQQPDSSLANGHLLWAARELKCMAQDAHAAAQDAASGALQELLRYLALFVGELLVQLHAKEAEVQGMLVQQLSTRTLQKLSQDLAAVAAYLHRTSESHA